jgi:hypothetical protein
MSSVEDSKKALLRLRLDLKSEKRLKRVCEGMSEKDIPG